MLFFFKSLQNKSSFIGGDAFTRMKFLFRSFYQLRVKAGGGRASLDYKIWIWLQVAMVRLRENEGVEARTREMESGPGSLAVCSKSQFGHSHSGTADYSHPELQAGHHCSKMTLLISQAAHQPSRGANGIPLVVCFYHA